MTFTLVHTADWQIGMKAQHVGSAGSTVRAARLQAAQRVVDLANREHADALILAGDTFEDSNVPRELVQRVVDILRQCRARVFVLPANHDPLVPRGVFEHPAWRDAAPHVHVFRDESPVAVDDVDLFPCPLKNKKSVHDPLALLPAYSGPRGRIRVGVAHGSLLNAGVVDADIANDFPMDLRHVVRASLDYLALGHWHIPSEHKVDGVVRAVYCGAHEPTAFGEASPDGTRRSGQCLLVRIESAGAPPVITAHRTAVLEWEKRTVALSSSEDVQRTRAELDSEPAASATQKLLDLVFTGSIPARDEPELQALETLAAARFLYARVRTKGLLVQPGDDAWLAALPAGAPQAAAQRLLEAAQGEGRDAEVARQALLKLFELSEEFRA